MEGDTGMQFSVAGLELIGCDPGLFDIQMTIQMLYNGGLVYSRRDNSNASQIQKA